MRQTSIQSANTQKTNQFNLTTKRYTEEKLREMIEEGADIYSANVKDNLRQWNNHCSYFYRKYKRYIWIHTH